MLALAFMTKSPAEIREEVPKAVTGFSFDSDFSSVSFPQGLAISMSRQKAEATLGMPFLVGGFLLQGFVLFVGSARLEWPAEALVALAMVGGVWLLAFVLWKTVVPRLHARTLAALDE
jgi:hypothetical protein